MRKVSSNYLIEFRFHGYARNYLKNLIYEVSRRFRVKGATRKRVVPHISLYGPFKSNQQKNVVNSIKEICQSYSLVPFDVSGFSYFNNPKNKVIYADIKPSSELKNLRRDLAKKLSQFTNSKSFDNKFDFSFHATIAFKDIDNKFSEIWKYIKSKEEPNIKQHLLRISIIKDGKILYEYDFMQRRLLNRQLSKNKSEWRKTIGILKSKIGTDEESIKKETLFDKIKSFLKWHFS